MLKIESNSSQKHLVKFKTFLSFCEINVNKKIGQKHYMLKTYQCPHSPKLLAAKYILHMEECLSIAMMTRTLFSIIKKVKNKRQT